MRSDPAALHERLAAYLQAQTVPTAERGPEFLISRNNGTLWLVRWPNGSVNWRTVGWFKARQIAIPSQPVVGALD